MCLPLRAFTEHLLSVRGARAQKAYSPTLIYSHVLGD
jgi:hypothetical protein